MPNCYIPKDNFEIPDNYGLTVYFVNGKKEEFELASHSLRDKVVIPIDNKINRYEPASCTYLEYTTKEDLWGWIPLATIQRLEFDKRFSKMIAIKEKNRKEV